MKVFADRHHQGLWTSFELLFEKRLGFKLYQPYGMDWYPDNWAIARPYGNYVGTARQYLQTFPKPERGISFEEFKHTKFDIIIASYYDHIEIYLDLIKKYQPQAKLITHFGNAWPLHPDTKNLLSSTSPFPVPRNINTCWYHQEFPVQTQAKKTGRNIYSFVNALQVNDIFLNDWNAFLHLEKLLPEYQCKSFGGGCRDGAIQPDKVQEKMNEAMFIFHLKNGGDGFGHVIHQAYALGIPPIISYTQYYGQLASKLMIAGKNCINVDGKTMEDVATEIRLYQDNIELYDQMCYSVRDSFISQVDYDKEEQAIKKFIDNLE